MHVPSRISEESIVSSTSEQIKIEKSEIDDLFRKGSGLEAKESSRNSTELIGIIDSKSYRTVNHKDTRLQTRIDIHDSIDNLSNKSDPKFISTSRRESSKASVI